MLYALFSVLSLALLALDQWVKSWTTAHFAPPVPPSLYATADPPLPFLPGILELTRVHNYGAAWSSFSGQRWLLVGLTSLILLAVLAILLRRTVRHPLGVLAGCLILSGGLGNIIDRVRLGYVVDMFHFQFWPSYPVFNVADICVVVGGIAAGIYYLFLMDKLEPREEDPHDGAGADR